MLEIKKVRRYKIACYPAGIYHTNKGNSASIFLKEGLATAAIMTVLESCGGVGVVGPPPLPPDLITENEARLAINKIFKNNNITLKPDFSLKIEQAPGDSVSINLDGYNDTLRVGYEYISASEGSAFTPAIIQKLDSLASDSGPYIRALEAVPDDAYDRALLKNAVQEFIDTLMAHGVI